MMSSISPRAFIRVPTAMDVALSSPFNLAAAQQATPLPRIDAMRITVPTKSSLGSSNSTSSFVLRPENVKNIGNKNTTAKGSIFFLRSVANTPRGMAIPRIKPPNTACTPITSAYQAAKQNSASTSAIIAWETPPSFSALRPKAASHLRPTVSATIP